MSESIRPVLSGSVRSRNEARAWFKAAGISVSDWARDHGFQRAHVYAALAGRTCGDRGHAHAVALALGIKPPPPDDFKIVRPVVTEQKEGLEGQMVS